MEVKGEEEQKVGERQRWGSGGIGKGVGTKRLFLEAVSLGWALVDMRIVGTAT